MSPALHSTLVGCAAVAALVSAGACLAQSPKTPSVRVHAVYGGTAAWWLFSMAMIAGSESLERADYWARLAQLGIGMLPGVIYHVNVAVAGLHHEKRRVIRVHYVVSAALTIFGLTFPGLLATPYVYSWGIYPAYTAWGAVPLGALLVVFAEVIWIYQSLLRHYAPGTPEHTRARAFHYGNCFAFLAAVDFLPAFGVPVYPIGFAFISTMYTATMFGAYRFRLVEITPEIAAERILETMPDGVLAVDARGVIRLANRAAAWLLGRPVEALIHQPLETIGSDPALLQAFKTAQARSSAAEEVHFRSARDEPRSVAIAGAKVLDPSGNLVARVWLLHDLTEQRKAEAERNKLEEWVRQTQKVESLGAMAGGIAHDFNNILMAILGSAEIAKGRLDAGLSAREEIDTISASATQAAELTDQLLTYAGRGTSIGTSIDLSALIREMADLLRSAISRNASLQLVLDDALPPIHGDRSQIRQVVLNLVTNASEALDAAAGTVTVRTGLLRRDTGTRVLLEVRDTGAGMDQGTQARMFDPFFTTKLAGRGLGLATVLRIVQGHRGVIGVTSQLATGTCIGVDFPALELPTPHAAVEASKTPNWTGRGVVLLADDEPAVRRVVRRILLDMGFEVVEAKDGLEATAAFRATPSDFAAVVLDVTMPVMNGRDAAAEMRRVSPSVPVVFISGYTELEGAESIGPARTAFLHKPFTPGTLAAKVREAIGVGGAAR